MFKRILLAITFAAALGAGGLGMSNQAAAWHDDCYGGYGFAYPAYYSSYYGYGYAPTISYYRSYPYPVYYGGYYGGHRHHHRHGHGGLRVSFGF